MVDKKKNDQILPMDVSYSKHTYELHVYSVS